MLFSLSRGRERAGVREKRLILRMRTIQTSLSPGPSPACGGGEKT
jgi:hypothetical protein